MPGAEKLCMIAAIETVKAKLAKLERGRSIVSAARSSIEKVGSGVGPVANVAAVAARIGGLV